MKQAYKVIWDLDGGIAGEGDRGSAKSAAKAKKIVAPTFSAPLLNGKHFDLLRATRGKVIVLTFWASWCKPCLAEAPYLAKLHHRYHGAAVVAVSIDTADDHSKLAKVVANMALPYPIPLDPDGHIFASYASYASYAKGDSIPLTLVIDRSGEIVYEHQNFLDGDQEKIEDVVQSTIQASQPTRSMPPFNGDREHQGEQ